LAFAARKCSRAESGSVTIARLFFERDSGKDHLQPIYEVGGREQLANCPLRLEAEGHRVVFSDHRFVDVGHLVRVLRFEVYDNESDGKGCVEECDCGILKRHLGLDVCQACTNEGLV
jgi:hypothetical protein